MLLLTCLRYTDRAGRKTYYDYDPMKRLARVQDAKGDTLQMDYNAEGDLSRLLDGAGNITKWRYTATGELLRKIYPDGSEQNYAYNGGRLSATQDARGRTTQFAYNNNGNLTGINYPNDADVSISYNNLDKPISMTDALGTTQFGYDNAARLTSVDGPWNNDTVSYAYDAEGRRSALGVQKPDGSVDSTSYVYDALGRLDMITSSAGTFNYNYQGDTSRITQLLNPNGTRTNYSYTALGELDVLHNVGVAGANISRYDYNYDARGVRTALQEQIEQDPVKTLQFSYDPSNQLAGEQVTGGKAGEAYTANYEYDSAGNRTRYEKTDAQGSTLTRSSNNKLNQTTATRTTAYGVGSTSGLTYDEVGNIAQVNSPNSGSSDYQFDDANRLKIIITRDAAGVAQSKTEFVYDAASMLRVSKTFTWSNGDWVSQSEKRRVYDGMNAVQERDGQGALLALYIRGMSMGGGIGGVLARVFDVGTSFMHYDGRGNVVQLSDVSGAVSGKYTYDAYGNTLSITGGAAGLNPYRFSTKETVGSLVYYGYRFYSPSLGKWINRDLIEEKGGVNLYSFAKNKPISNIDHYGLFGIPGVVIGAVIGATAGGFNADGNGVSLTIGIIAGAVGGGLGGFFGNPIIGGLISGIVQQLLIEMLDKCKGVNWGKVGIAGLVGGLMGTLSGIGKSAMATGDKLGQELTKGLSKQGFFTSNFGTSGDDMLSGIFDGAVSSVVNAIQAALPGGCK